MKEKRRLCLAFLMFLCMMFLAACQTTSTPNARMIESSGSATITMDTIPAYTDSAYVAINDNKPYFTDTDLTTTAFERYSELDSLGRCGVAYANICQELMPADDRESIGQVKPTGWHSVKYDCVDGKYLYNRCHLIGYQLAGENANKQNLITGTRYLNIDGMLPFENMVTDYVKESGNHVLYRVTPVYEGNNLVASGVLMEGLSVEDEGEDISFNVFCYNVQPGVVIDYATGDSQLGNTASASTAAKQKQTYILNTKTHKFHNSNCSIAVNEENRKEYTGGREDLIAQGYSPCGRCKP